MSGDAFERGDVMQPGFSNLQPTPGYKGDDPGTHDPLIGDTASVGRPRILIKRVLALLNRRSRRPKA